MNTTALKSFYIILGLGACALAAETATAQVGLGPVNRTIDRTLERRLPRVEDRLEAELARKAAEAEEAAREAAQDPLAESLPAATVITETLDASGKAIVDGVTSVADGANLRPFVADVDPFGNAIEKNTLLVLVQADQLDAIRAAGFTIIDERELSGLGLIRLTLRSAQGYGLAEKALEIKSAFPDAAVDYNHLYRFQESAPNETVGDTDARTAPPAREAGGGAALRIGLIDSALFPGHSALQKVSITGQDFVTHDAERPLGHGTAVASLLARASDTPLSIYAASVFFQAPGHAPGASTESLLGALDWLAAENVDVINMSLAGPANALLEQALAHLAATSGPTVVAAVGNNGPAGAPMYPGAYESVVGVTAIDRKNRVFRYANRGEHVDFAALGVDVKVASADGGWRLESGTSMAAPRVAVFIGHLQRGGAGRGEDLLALLKNHASDLGRPGFDPVFGHGVLLEPPEIVSRIKTPLQD